MHEDQNLEGGGGGRIQLTSIESQRRPAAELRSPVPGAGTPSPKSRKSGIPMRMSAGSLGTNLTLQILQVLS